VSSKCAWWSGRTVALVDLFRRAARPQGAGGIGKGIRPPPGKRADWTTDQEKFLDQAAGGLALEDKVVPVRLALFAEMVKGKPWTPATLTAVGGTAGSA